MTLAVFTAWAFFDMYSTEGLIPSLLFPVVLGLVPPVVDFLLKLPVEIVIVSAIWVIAGVGLVSGIFDGVTGFPSKRSGLSISVQIVPIAFAFAMVVNSVLVIGGLYFAVKWLMEKFRDGH